MKMIKEPIYVTQPLLPDLNDLQREIEKITKETDWTVAK